MPHEQHSVEDRQRENQVVASRGASLARADAIIVPSQRMATILAAAGLRRLRVVPNAISLEEIPYSAWPGGQKEVLLPSASGSERKGLAHFLEVAKRVKATRPESRFVATNFQGSPLVEGTAFLTRPEFLDRLRRSYAIVTPALWEEPFGLVLIEAMAAGRPVVAYETGAASEIIVHNETGFVVPRGDIAALTSAINRLLSDEPLAQRMGLAGRKRVVERYSVPRMVQGYLDVIDAVLSRARP